MTFDLADLGKRSVWLTSFWGFDPDKWGGVGFTQERDRAAYAPHSSNPLTRQGLSSGR